MGLLLPSTVRVTRNITIQTPKDSLYQYISDLQKWKLWLEGADSVDVKFISTSTGGQGATAMIGNQKVSITKTSNNEIETTWYSRSNKSQKGIFQFSSDSSSNNTNLNWYFEQKVGFFPWERLPTIANDKVLGPFMEHSLDKLKAVAGL